MSLQTYTERSALGNRSLQRRQRAHFLATCTLSKSSQADWWEKEEKKKLIQLEELHARPSLKNAPFLSH